MNKLNILEAGIKKKIQFIEKNLLNKKDTDNHLIGKTPEYLDIISKLKKENMGMSNELEVLRNEHSQDLRKIDQLLKQLSELMENDDA